VVNADGSSVTTQQDKNGDLSPRDQTVTTLSADGLSRTTQHDADGNGTFELTTTDVTAHNADGSVTQTVTDRSADSIVRGQTVTLRCADGVSRTIQVDANGDGHLDQVETIALQANGSVVDTVSDLAPNGTLKDRTIATTSADGRTRTSQLDVDGDSVIDLTRVQSVAGGAGGSSVTTTTEYNGNGTLRDRTVVTVSADGLSKTTQKDTTGASTFNRTQTDVIVLNADGSKTETVRDASQNGTTL